MFEMKLYGSVGDSGRGIDYVKHAVKGSINSVELHGSLPRPFGFIVEQETSRTG